MRLIEKVMVLLIGLLLFLLGAQYAFNNPDSILKILGR